MYDIKSERNQLMIENHNLRQENADLEEKLKSVDCKLSWFFHHTDVNLVNTNRTGNELKRIETLLSMVDLEEEKEHRLHEVPSVTTALNRLKEHHEDNCEKMTEQIQAMKHESKSRVSEIERLKSAIHELTAPSAE